MWVIPFFYVAVINLSPAFSVSDDVYRSKTSDEYVPCENGWHYFRDKCYRIAGRTVPEKFMWSAAVNLCRRYGGDLVSIQSQEEQNFITAYLQLDVEWGCWIGLNDRDKEGDYRWSDGSVFNYTNWRSGEPSNTKEENCVHIIFEPPNDLIGQWHDRPCERDFTEYALCEMKKNPRRRSPNLRYCSREDGGGWKHGSSCYHIVTESMSWESAERHCKYYYKGHLLTIQDKLEDVFIELALPDIEKEIWIGIKIQDELQQKWSSGWYVSYERFNKDERYVEGTCVARKNGKEWITIPCSSSLHFICEVSKVTPPVLVPPPAGSHCPKALDNWRDFGGDYCYYIETTKRVNFYEASFDCNKRRGNLLSLHSKAEEAILLPFFKYKHHFHQFPSFYIGLIRLEENNGETFGWTDGSALDYHHWRYSEPNRLDEDCVEVMTQDMEWRDNMCTRKLFGYICSVKKVVPNASTAQSNDDCKRFCVPPNSYLYGLLRQCPDANEI